MNHFEDERKLRICFQFEWKYMNGFEFESFSTSYYLMLHYFLRFKLVKNKSWNALYGDVFIGLNLDYFA